MSTRSAARSRQSSRTDPLAQDSAASVQDEKENAKVPGPPGRSRVTRRNSKAYCVCRKPDDGSPMIHCSSCKDWFHFRCVELSEKDAEEIQLYICPSCQQKTGARVIKEWEGPEAVQEAMVVDIAAKNGTSSPRSKKPTRKPAVAKTEESDVSSEGSDEYHPEVKTASTHRTHRQTRHSDNDSDSGESIREKSPKRLRHASITPKDPALPMPPSPAPINQQKRKKSLSAHQPPPKRPRSESTAGDDAVRKYCLGKLQGMFSQIFTRYPFLPSEDSEGMKQLSPHKKPEELTSEEKEGLETRARQFGHDLEQCLYELFSEPDKQGKQVAAGKYKERFRMLTFNLSKADRVVLHMRIASSHISPKELSTMSSTDLASEEEQQSIKKLEEEALAHSILKKSTVPRAKLTHKGLQDIEDVTGAGQREAEREREEEERIERERLARLRQQAQRAQTQGSAPPESPVVPQTPTWGGPPPAPHASETSPPTVLPMGRPSVHPLFVPSVSDFAGSGPVENELNLADLINIDEEPSGEVAMTPVDSIPTPFGEVPQTLAVTVSEQASPSSASPVTPAAAGISPFAAKGSQPEASFRPSFDLNALWTPPDHPEPQSTVASESQDAADNMVTEPAAEEFAPETEDQDFDMFLNANDQEQGHVEELSQPAEPPPAEIQPSSFDDQPPVWSGTVSMPLDSAIPQEVAVYARQAGGRTLGDDSPLWKTLFPSVELRIDGRVPVEKSAQYLTQVRLNPTKELIAVAFSPVNGVDPSGFNAVKNHLLSKSRHGLIFPWGHNPKSSAPGRELYVVPLMSTDSIPEYMELLDQLQLPPTRSVDYLVGIWVLNKGKLAPPPIPVVPAFVSSTLAPAPPLTSITAPTFPNIDLAHLQQLGLIQPPQPAQAPPPPPPMIHSPPVPPQPQTVSSASPPPVNLAAEVAQLTPGQIQLMLQTLTKTSQGGSAPLAIPSQHDPYGVPNVQQPAPPPVPIALPQAALQAWSNPGAPPYPGPAPYQHPHPHPQPTPFGGGAPPTQPYGGPGPGERYERNGGGGGAYHTPYEYDRGFRGGRGARGRGGGWQKPRGRGGPSQRNRGRGGGGGWDQR
ncbi:hypothetical protein BC628DRAFT_1397687 [Trametes gibbosa]|nr:hypothetical protein BC628DRAFT_1397687 [Trametes gibbosa]